MLREHGENLVSWKLLWHGAFTDDGIFKAIECILVNFKKGAVILILRKMGKGLQMLVGSAIVLAGYTAITTANHLLFHNSVENSRQSTIVMKTGPLFEINRLFKDEKGAFALCYSPFPFSRYCYVDEKRDGNFNAVVEAVTLPGFNTDPKEGLTFYNDRPYKGKFSTFRELKRQFREQL